MWVYSSQNREKSYFCTNLPPRGKGEYRCTTTNLLLCNDTVIVSKITPLHSVSVISNFVVPKRDPKNQLEIKLYASPPHGNAIPTGPFAQKGYTL